MNAPDPTPHAERRARLIATMRDVGGGVAVIPTAPERARNRDTHFPYRHDSYCYYLSGFIEPEAVLVLIAGPQPRSILFCRAKHEEREIWDGFRYGPEAARAAFGFDEAYAIEELDARLPPLLAGALNLFASLGHDPEFDGRLTRALNAVRSMVRAGLAAPAAIRDVRVLIDPMRAIKDPTEIATMRRAAEISCSAHKRAMRAAGPGRYEYEVEAELLHEFRRRGAQAPAYSSIVAGGANACVLHYVPNNAVLRDGDLLLIDAGCELDSYASDITRTFPINGRFSPAQQELYEIVLAAQAAAVAATRPAAPYNAPHEAAVRVLAQGMLDCGLLSGSLEDVIAAGDRREGGYFRFYMHRTGHWLGLDVHDAGDYKAGGEWLPLAPGNVVTVEPGIYVRPAPDVAEKYWNIGIRIEDDALITSDGCELITSACPKSVADIEAWMRGSG
ncbi:MAG: aminopeptidase P N-terminal domain-containing protein [Burkholderiales bacterium]|nr:aminopeptidase P N-terminal domain-containing protein [Burkholderiales bacterium]